MTANQTVSRRSALTAAGALGVAGAVFSHAATAEAAPPQTDTAALIGPAGDGELHIMSFNIRFDNPAAGPGNPDFWQDRIGPIRALLATEQPTIMGVQEALFHQLMAIEEALPEYFDFVGYGRDGGSEGEYSAIFFDDRRLDLLEWDQYWLSDNPELIGSATWGNTVTRIVTWGRFKDLSTGRQVLVVNTHFDHESENARIRSAQALLELEARHPGIPTILTGDFNSRAEASSAYSTLVRDGGVVDTWNAAARRLTPEYGTFPDYQEPVVDGGRIDWILATPDVAVLQAAINTSTTGGRYPSDHAPVQALVRLT
ncbi:endonuclease/exonuclease/phosphatase family protein [Pseudarthrobacter sp. PS3-L1]|uniref:endonuclease/exonuclease/phosphatase family protein n=1 Tax=Pseudarthrobacter sp. PS3-L1 TaxID=3046207 RepID=UPI0024BA4918|nr:endonuclease/exonuclease/phosphatase family protein [Pseudarthrobacter sp. PS3-L1]MDJ0321036.1 endonuclease/exonuclease/phosphatase family protein [Pseudarthrobacter sp. PS3-L1]